MSPTATLQGKQGRRQRAPIFGRREEPKGGDWSSQFGVEMSRAGWDMLKAKQPRTIQRDIWIRWQRGNAKVNLMRAGAYLFCGLAVGCVCVARRRARSATIAVLKSVSEISAAEIAFWIS